MLTDFVPIAATFSKDPSFWGARFPIQYLIEGSGGRVKDNNDRWYVDWVSGLGAILLGYSNESFIRHVQDQVLMGAGFSLPQYLEYAVSEKLCHTLQLGIPAWRKIPLQVRWVKTGSDACNTAVRVARAITRRNLIWSSGYHGQHDTFVGATPPAHGITHQHIRTFEFGQIPDLSASRAACVIIEQGLVEPEPLYYSNLRAECDRTGALLIMDEVVTGLRYGLGGATGRYGVEPDMVCLGKALGNGMPIAAVVAPVEHMSWFDRDDPVFVSSTNAGDAVSLAAADAVLDVLLGDANFYARLRSMGVDLMEMIDGILVKNVEGVKLLGTPERSLVTFENKALHAAFMYYMAEDGVLMNRPNFPHDGHTQGDLEQTKTALKVATAKLASLVKHERVAEWEPFVARSLFSNR